MARKFDRICIHVHTLCNNPTACMKKKPSDDRTGGRQGTTSSVRLIEFPTRSKGEYDDF